jgi:acetyl esterase/lipase
MIRALLTFIAVFLTWTAALGQAPSQEMVLWRGSPPGPAHRIAGPERTGDDGAATGAVWNVSTPRMEIYRPARPNGTAVLVVGGGGYFRIQIGSAARPMARWLQTQGVTAFVLYYRLPGDGWPADAPFQDGQRAMRLIRAQATRFGLDVNKIGVIGSSAGGHLAGMLATQGEAPFYPPTDVADRLPARPNFAGLIYPVVSLRAPIDTTRTRRELGSAPDAVTRFSIEQHVDGHTPPIFLAHAADDPIADPRHSQWLFEAMRAASRPAELHLFTRGGHSFGMGPPGSAVAAWPLLFARWARDQGFM